MIFTVLCFVFMKHTQFISTVLDLKYFAVLKKSENILFEFYYNVGFHQFQKMVLIVPLPFLLCHKRRIVVTRSLLSIYSL